ncbi:efflux RND transporter permease subunit [Sulfuricurvum sp.]|uniref:efflux RND transporter permease subunit n=1 Tax=Sulfuricurvum sp. TaxID=2025608 RepID=UPI0035638369
MNKLISLALTQRVLVFVAMIMLLVGGYTAFKKLPFDAFPEVSSPQVKIIMKAPGMTPEEVETRIIAPIETEMLGIPNQKLLRSTAKYGISDITIDFKEGTDIYWARAQISEKLNGMMGSLPASASGGLAPITTPLGEIFMFTVEGNLTLAEKRTLLDWTIRPILRTIPGVADFNSLGGEVKSYLVKPNYSILGPLGISVKEIETALKSNNKNDGAGRIHEGEEAFLVRSEGNIKNLDDIRSIVLRNTDGRIVRVGDVAVVEFDKLTRSGFMTKNGISETVAGQVLSLKGANARDITAEVKEKLSAIKLPKGVSLDVYYDRSNLVDKSIYTVSKALIEAVVLVLILLLLFLGDFRAAITVAVMVPMAVLATFILIRQFGMSANLMSLGGLTIAIGMLVDSGIVVVENIIGHLGQSHGKNIPKLHIIYRATKEVSTPVVSGIIIIAMVFLPLMSLEGIEGKMFIPVALTIIFALLASLILSMTVIPVLASVFLKVEDDHESWLVRKLMALYSPALVWALANGRKVTLGAIGALFLAGLLYTQIGKTFMPTLDEGDVVISFETIPSVNIDASKELILRIEKKMMERIPEIKTIVARTGSDELGLDPMGLGQSDAFFVLKPMNEWRVHDKEWILNEMRQVVVGFPGVTFSFGQPIEMRISEMLTGVRGDVALKIFGTDLTKLNQIALQIQDILKKTDGSIDVLTPINEGMQYLRIDIDRLAVGNFGLSVDEVQELLKTALEGSQIGIVIQEGRRSPVIVRGENNFRDSVSAFSNMLIALPNGKSVPLSALAKIERIEGPVLINRESGMRMSVIRSNVQGRDLVSFVEEAKAKVAKEVDLPDGYYLKWGGEFENQQRAAARLAIVVPIAIAFIFLLLFITFGSMKQAGLVLTNIPFAMIGGVVALWLSGEYLSVPASVGFIALLGIAVLNGVVMVTYFNQLRSLGHSIHVVVVEGAKRRFRPVMMTASIAAFGLVPLLFATGPGSEIQKPLAIVVIGGLITSTLLTLILLPIFYRWLESTQTEKEELA